MIVDQCEAHGIKKVVFSPGSRNAPFAISFDEHPFFDTYVIHDERCAAFFAMGMASELNEPVVLCCTSGSAGLNYYPAIAEAFYRSIPLLVITADRPSEWTNQGDGQTIMQNDLYGSHVRQSISLDDSIVSEDSIWKAQLDTATCFSILKGTWRGPVHLNVGLNEPLYNKVEKTKNFSRQIAQHNKNELLSPVFLSEASSILRDSKILVLCGQMPPNEKLKAQLEIFAGNSNVVTLVENTSNLYHESFISCIDRALNGISSEKEIEFYPDLLITLGGAVVSKKIKSFLRKSKPTYHWKIGYEFPFMDTYKCLTDSIQLLPETFFEQLNKLTFQQNKLNFFGKWKSIDYQAKDLINDCIQQLNELTDIVVFDAFFGLLPENSILHMANSSVVRYCQLFDPIQNVRFESNRGTSGIDGSTSTAVGAAIANPNEQFYLITGDISFLYDSNALWISEFPKNLRILVINNQGGGIFKIIPGPSNSDQRDRYFEAVHTQSAFSVAKAFGLVSNRIENINELITGLADFFNLNNDIQLLEITTNPQQNPKDLDYFFNFIRNNE